jgi:hypothetical protein
MFAAFDLDSTLIESEALIDYALYNQGIEMVDHNDTYLYKFKDGKEPPPDFQWDLFFYKLFTEKYDQCGPVDEYVYDFLKECYGDGREPIRVITSRPQGVLMGYASEMVLKANFPDIDFSIDILKDAADKKRRYMFGADIIFEDRRKTAIEMAQDGFIVFLRNRTYNTLPDNIKLDLDVYPVEKFDPHLMRSGSIITFDNYGQLLAEGVSGVVAPIENFV